MNKAAEKLRQLARADDRPDAARLREIMGDVEAALESGVTRQKVFEALKEAGFQFKDIRSFDSTLYRIRKQRSKQGIKPSAPELPAAEVEETTLSQALDPARREQKFNQYVSKSNPLKGNRK